MKVGGLLVASLALAASASSGLARSPQLTLPIRAAAPGDKAGVQRLGEQALFYRPAVAATRKRPVLVLLHGAGMSAQSMIDGARSEADRCDCLLLSVKSKAATWDTIGLARNATSRKEMFGEDAGRVERALAAALTAKDADRRSVILFGFSDGASYALSLGLANPQLFRGVVAIAPGFHLEPAAINPKQRLFIAHSPQDKMLSFERTRDGIVPSLRRAGFDLRFRSYDGGHRIDRPILADGIDFVLGRSGGKS